ncbi:MAG: Eco57I restriction-modification methylase domain-containing protein, partial [Streptosporangiaceae bacterium]
AELRKAAGWSHLLRESGRYPLTGRGDINTYAVFAETARTVINAKGRSGLVLPTGIATDATTAPFFGRLVRNGKLVSFLDFENEAFLLSHAVDHRVRFCLLTVCGAATRVDLASFAFGTRYIQDLPARRFAMPPEEILLVNPNTGTTPVFRSRRDAEITIGIYKRVPVLWRDDPEENPWGISFMRMLDMANDSGLFRTHDQLERDGWTLTGNVFMRGSERMLPLYEAKMIHHFDHRLGTYHGQTDAQANMGTLPRLTPEQQDDPDFVVMPRYWVQDFDTLNKQKSKPNKPVHDHGVASRLEAKHWDRGWLLGWRDVCRSTDERTVICGVLPRAAVGHTYPLMLSKAAHIDCLYANLTSFVLDYVARQKLAGTHLTYGYLNQLPILPPGAYGAPAPWLSDAMPADWIRQRVLELSFTAWGMEAFARDLGDDGPPFRWSEGHRNPIRAELDAAYFHLYGLERDEVEHVMGSFDALRRREERPQNFGEFRTKRLILERYDAMAEAIRTGEPYQTVLDPPAGYGPRHPAR